MVDRNAPASSPNREQRLRAWVGWAAEAADVGSQLIAFVPVTTAGARQKYEPEGYGSRDDNEPVLHGFHLWHSLA